MAAHYAAGRPRKIAGKMRETRGNKERSNSATFVEKLRIAVCDTHRRSVSL